MQPRGMRTFLIVWAGQLVSLIGSTLTSFTLSIWVYQGTGSVTDYALLSTFITLPAILISPLAGAVVDRWDRRRVMILSDTGAACCTVILVLLVLTGRLELWNIYLLTAISSTFSAFQSPAYTAATTLLVSKEHYARASGMVDFAGAIGYIISPLLGGFLLSIIDLEGVMLLDVATFLVALFTLSIVHFPRPAATPEGQQAAGSLLRESIYGWSYIGARPGLRALLILFAIANLFNGATTVLVIPLILSFESAEILGLVASLSTTGFMAGGLLMSVWGGPRRRISGVSIFGSLSALAMMLVGLRPSAVLVGSGLWGFFAAGVGVNACSQAIWQSKVAPDIQGRVFSVRSMISMSTLPVASLSAGALADYIFEPLMATNGALANDIGSLIGTGAGRGIGLMFILMGLLLLLTVLAAYWYPHLRRVEDELPDFAHETETVSIK